MAFGLSLDIAPAIIAKGIADVTVSGRNEVFRLPNGAFAVVDYAHTPDALERVLLSLRPLTSGKLVCLFGCGGDRDRSKRAIMGGIAENGADQVVLTSDNPRSESPAAILSRRSAGACAGRVARRRVTEDRRAAIRRALGSLGSGDCLLIAGKVTRLIKSSDRKGITSAIRRKSMLGCVNAEAVIGTDGLRNGGVVEGSRDGSAGAASQCGNIHRLARVSGRAGVLGVAGSEFRRTWFCGREF